MKYTKEIKKGFLITGTIVVFLLIAIIILVIVANLDYNAVSINWNNLMNTLKIQKDDGLSWVYNCVSSQEDGDRIKDDLRNYRLNPNSNLTEIGKSNTIEFLKIRCLSGEINLSEIWFK